MNKWLSSGFWERKPKDAYSLRRQSRSRARHELSNRRCSRGVGVRGLTDAVRTSPTPSSAFLSLLISNLLRADFPTAWLSPVPSPFPYLQFSGAEFNLSPLSMPYCLASMCLSTSVAQPEHLPLSKLLIQLRLLLSPPP